MIVIASYFPDILKGDPEKSDVSSWSFWNMNNKNLNKPFAQEGSKNDKIAMPEGIALNRENAAAFIYVSPPTLDRLTKRGFLNPNRATRRPLYLVEELKSFLNNNRGRDVEPSNVEVAWCVGKPLMSFELANQN